MSLINDLISAVNCSIDGAIDLKPQRMFGITERVQIDGLTYPVEIAGTNGEKITPDDGYAFTGYWREISINENRDPERGYGNKVGTEFDYELRFYGIGHRARLDRICKGLDFNLLSTVRDAMPGADEITIDGNLNNLQFEVSAMVTNTADIFGEEFSGIDPNTLNVLGWSAFYMNVNFRGYYCGDWCDIGTVTIT